MKIRVVVFCIIMSCSIYQTKNDVIIQKSVKRNYLKYAIVNFQISVSTNLQTQHYFIKEDSELTVHISIFYIPVSTR
jgi:hypothetical protein